MHLLNIFNLSLPQMQAVVLMFVRVSAIVVTAPLLGSMNVPRQVKAGLSVMLTMAVLPAVGLREVYLTGAYSLVVAMIGEVLIGIIIGFTARLLFSAVELAGQFIGFQMGFGIVNVIDPQTSAHVSIISQWQNVITLLMFLALDVHYWFILALTSSFEYIPMLAFSFTSSLMEAIVNLTSNMFVIAVKIAAPVIAALLFTNVALGMIARTVPQINVFIVGFPLQIAVGLVGIALSLPLFSYLMRELFQKMGEDITLLMKLMT